MEHLESTPIIDIDGTVYGIEPPSNEHIKSTINDLMDEMETLRRRLDELNKPKWESGYLRSKYG